MHFDFLLIGQGICGTFLSHALQQAGYSFLVIDDSQSNAASKVAAGVMNPITGRRMVKTWMIDEILPFAVREYAKLGELLQVTAIEQKDIVDFYPTPQMKLAFESRYGEDAQYLALPEDENAWRPYFNYDFGYGSITPSYLVNLPAILPAYRRRLLQQNNLLEETFELTHLQVQSDKVQYKDITAQRIIFCDGIASFNNPWFTRLPFAGSKGEALLVQADNIPSGNIFKKGLSLVPWQDNIFWVGSTYEWEFENDQPTEAFREKTMAALKHWLKKPVTLLDHRAAIRPSTLERRPFVGFHPTQPAVGIFNGMGTKGCSLAPFFAPKFVQHIQHQTPLQPEASVQRFTRILSK